MAPLRWALGNKNPTTLKYSWLSHWNTLHSFAASGFVTFRCFFVVVQLKCIAGCFCYWNKVQCIKWLPLMGSCALWLLLWRTNQWLHIINVFPLFFHEETRELWSLWHLVKYCYYFWLGWGIAALWLSFNNTKAQRPAFNFMVLENKSACHSRGLACKFWCIQDTNANFHTSDLQVAQL